VAKEDCLVEPLLLEKEETNFVNTFKTPFFNHLANAPTQHFTYIVIMVEQIEHAIKVGKIADPVGKKGFTRKKNDADVNSLHRGSC
jgi:phosphopentomutase